jgi:1-acyl-sn-glycerol-3-phosphate acyltransferase
MGIYPEYPKVLTPLAWQIVAAALVGKPRSFKGDAARLVEQVRPPVEYRGLEHAPLGGAALLVSNHYFRPGFDAWWVPFAISAAAAEEVHWIITAERTYPGQQRGLVMRPIERLFLACVAQVYGFFRMPPMPPDPRQVEQRALAVRQVVEYVRRTPGARMGLAPEGRDLPGGVLGWPPPGGGRFMLALARLGLSLAPAGVFEEGGRLVVQFGPAFPLTVPPGLRGAALDCSAARQVMQRIAALLPAELRGEFAPPPSVTTGFEK